ncbi:MAG: hypothetical protein RLZZ248_79 [Bacteroidota bacterium]|jgi:type II secretory pathway pseudopilin PulG
MKLAINLALAIVVAGLVWVLIGSIQEPIAFKAEKDKREKAVVDQLMIIRNAQEMYRDIKGEFAPTFDTLVDVLTNDSFMIVSIIGDPDDPNFTGEIIYDTTYSLAIEMVLERGIDLSKLDVIPYSNGMKFDIQADIIEYQSTNVPVVEVGTRRENFMGAFSDPRFARYDSGYEPKSVIKFGNMNAPNLAGNWER